MLLLLAWGWLKSYETLLSLPAGARSFRHTRAASCPLRLIQIASNRQLLTCLSRTTSPLFSADMACCLFGSVPKGHRLAEGERRCKVCIAVLLRSR